jgi:hypothetical protein
MTRKFAGLSTQAKVLVSFICLLSLTAPSLEEVRAEGTYAKAVGHMKREQALGESGAGLLKTFAKDDLSTLVQGIQLYALAQADFNALLETLKGALIKGEDLSGSVNFQSALNLAVKRRVAFTDFVEDKVISQIPEGSRSIAALFSSADFLKGAAELLKVLKDAGLEIWREYRSADERQRQQISDQLDTLQWRSYDKVPAMG